MAHRRRIGARLLIAGVVLMLGGGLLAWLIQTAGDVRVMDVRFVSGNATPMSALLYVPRSATAQTPAPGILAVHGYFNSREAQSGFAIEFARRGYVVLALDQRGHGYSSPPAFADGFGGPAGLAYLRSLDFVDKDNIGLEGHSMGGWTVLSAAAAFPDSYKAIVLEGSSTGAPFAPDATTETPRNLAVVFARYDEFSQVMWGVSKATEIVQSAKLQRAFGTDAPVEPGRVYGSIDQGTARVLYTPGGTHPFNHLSTEAIGHSIEWFQKTLDGGRPLDPADQIWPWKELGTLIAFIGCVVFMLGVIDAALDLPCFATLNSAPEPARPTTLRWWVALAASVALPLLTYFPFLELGERILAPSALWPQGFTNQILTWALLSALIVTALSFLPGSARHHQRLHVVKAFALAALGVGAAYVALAVSDFLFTIDFRFWFVALKLLSKSQAVAFLAYLVPFTIVFVLLLRALHLALPPARYGAGVQYLTSIAALAGGFVILVAVEYVVLFSSGRLVTVFMNDTLRTVIAIQFVPLMTLVAVVSTFLFRRTASYLPGAFVCALFVTWYVVAGQATHIAG
jgi:pimeloyl-ACP methyl ester carboxylesterase